MTTHWIIAIGRPKLAVMSGKAILTAVSSATTEVPRPISIRGSRRPPSCRLASSRPLLSRRRRRPPSRPDPRRARRRLPPQPRRLPPAGRGRRILAMRRRPMNAGAPAGAPALFALAVHGGAGTIDRKRMSKEALAAHHDGLRRALHAGYRVLAAGGGALDAVTEAVVALEDDPLFNAGRGASLTAAGTFEMDAAIMDGRDRRAGAVAALCGPKN